MNNLLTRAGTRPAPTGPLALMAAALVFSGCAAVGQGLKIAGDLSGQKGLSNAGQSMSRAAETKEFNEEEKYYTGRTVAADLLQTEKASDDRALEAYVGNVGQSVAMASGMGTLPQGWHFILLEGAEPNAFACPGGFVFISKGLVKLCQNEDELAGALAHEVAHIALDHPMKAISAANQKAALMSLASWGAEQALKGKDLGQLTQTFDSVVKEVGKAVSHGYDRGKEGEADKAAVGILVELGYDPRGLKRVLERITAGDHSHGDPKARAAAVEAEAYSMEPTPKLLAARTDRFKNNVK